MRTDSPAGFAALALLALATPAAVTPAAAQDRPAFPPSADVAVTYRVQSSERGVPPEVVMRYSAASDRIRLDGGMPGYVLVDHKTRHAVIVMEPLGLMMDAPPRAGVEQAFMLENARHFVRRGTETRAGLRCTVWEVAGETANGTACVTHDGIILRAAGSDAHGRSGSIEATRVDRARQAEAQFFPPPGTRAVTTAPGGAQQGLAGMLSGPDIAAVLDRLRGRQP